MRLDVTRDVVNDLWPLCKAGEASADSRALVDAYLAHDREFGAVLREANGLQQAMPSVRLSPDAERRLLDDARRRARTKLLVVGAGLAFAALLAAGAFVALLLFMGRTS